MIKKPKRLVLFVSLVALGLTLVVFIPAYPKIKSKFDSWMGWAHIEIYSIDDLVDSNNGEGAEEFLNKLVEDTETVEVLTLGGTSFEISEDILIANLTPDGHTVLRTYLENKRREISD